MDEITSFRSPGLEPGDSPQVDYCLIRTLCRSELELDVRRSKTEVVDRPMFIANPARFRDLILHCSTKPLQNKSLANF
jgi:hypothetical protein